MNIETKYAVGDVIRFSRPIKQVNGKSRKPETHVGIIEKIVVTAAGHHYTAKSSFSGAIREEWIEGSLS